MTLLIGPAPCKACREPLYLVRTKIGLQWVEPAEGRGRVWQWHGHRRGWRCRQLMSRKDERCARRVGHRGDHRTRSSMDAARDAARRRRAS